MGKIVLLDDLTINQIAAGEVIERPASVVKELVENSIDAGAKKITVEIKNGGISYIRVSDDGSGIMPDDMEIAFERHATSKIRKADDLNEVKSMGFRGEALASIAAIAKVELVSRTSDSDIRYKVIAEGGQVQDKHEEGAQKGTTITIRELFFNTPVRYKFLKKDFTESGYIEDVITRIALANPDVAIKLVNTGKTVIQTNGNGKLEDCVYEIFGREVYDNLLPVDYTYENYHATGVIGKPIISRSNRSNQIFFINKRYVKDKTLTSAAEQGFKGLVTVGKHGFLIINIDMDSSKVDVNVHPTKLEVRFQEDSKMFKTVYHAIKETLLKSDLVSDPVKDYEDAKPQDIIKGISNKQRAEAWNIEKSEYNNEDNKKTKEELEKTQPIPNINIKDEDSIEEELPKYELEENVPPLEEIDENEIEIKGMVAEDEVEEKKDNKNENDNETKVEEVQEKLSFEYMYKKMFGRDLATAKKEYDERTKENELYDPINPISGNEISIFDDESLDKNPQYKFIGIAFKTYILLTKGDTLYMLDQHAAHERIMYEKVKANYYNDTNKDSQLMLLPDVVELSNKEMGIFKDNKELFEKAGFVVEEFGDSTVKITGVPDFCIDFDNKELFLETLDEIDTVARTAKQELEEKFLATVACKAAVKANMVLSEGEVNSLMEQLLKLPNPFSCPHGRPTIIKMTKADIEKKFSRRM